VDGSLRHFTYIMSVVVCSSVDPLFIIRLQYAVRPEIRMRGLEMHVQVRLPAGE